MAATMIDDATQLDVIAACESALTALAPTGSADDAARVCIEAIVARLPHYHWLGVYWLDGDTLHLGHYVGEPTEHTRISVGRGVCGTAVATNANQLIDDVTTLENYLSCSVSVRAEIVVLIRDASGTILGQLDADSHDVAAFDATDETFLERVAALLSPIASRARGGTPRRREERRE